MNSNDSSHPSFFTSSLFSASTENKEHLAASRIQKNWKVMHLRHTTAKASYYLNHVISQAWAKEQTYDQLQSSLLNPEKINATQMLLMYLEQIKDFLLPHRAPISFKDKTRAFLFAYLVATNGRSFLNPSFKDDRLLHHYAKKMLHAFEQLLSSIATNQLETINDYKERGGLHFLAQFHHAQFNYYDVYTEWKSNNPNKLLHFCLEYYNQFESKRLAILYSLKNKQLDLYAHIVEEQIHIKNKIERHFGHKGLSVLMDSIMQCHSHFEKQKWIITPPEFLHHEVALDPQFSFSPQTFARQPRINPVQAVNALNQESNAEPLFILFDDLLKEMVSLTPNNKAITNYLYGLLNKKQLIELIETNKTVAFYSLVNLLLIHIRKLESPAHQIETQAFIDEYSLSRKEWPIIIQAIEFIYSQIGQILLEKNNFILHQSRTATQNVIVTLEQKRFKTYSEAYSTTVLTEYIKEFVAHPEKHRLSLALLCSRYSGSYFTHALVLHLLQSPQKSIISLIPESFYLDRIRLMDFHTQYQNIIHAAAALSYVKMYCQQYHIFLSHDEWVEKKNWLLTLLSNPFRPAKDSDILQTLLIHIFNQQDKQLKPIDKNAFIRLINQLQDGSAPVIPLLNERLGNLLNSYFIKGRLPDTHIGFFKETDLDIDLLQLGEAIMPMMRLHIKVHSPLYQQEINNQLWAPLWHLLKQEAFPQDLPVLFLIEESTLKSIHQTLHKLAFLITGLTLINQTLIHHDMWQPKGLDHSTLKREAISHRLLAKIYHADTTKDNIEQQLGRLMHDLAEQQDIDLETISAKQINHMFLSAKKEHSHLYKACLDELIKQLRNHMNPNNKTNLQHLASEFQEELDWLHMKLKQCMDTIKKHHMNDDHEPTAQPTLIIASGFR